MKIMHIAGGGDNGGAKTHILALCSRLKDTNDLTLISLRSGDFAEEAKKHGIKTAIFSSKAVLPDYFRLILMIKKEQPDIIHCHGAKANVAAVFIKLFCKCTIVTTVHSDYKLDYMHSAIKRNTIGRLNTAALRVFDYYVTVSNTFRHMMLERGFSPLKMMTIYNGLDFSQHTPPFDRAEYLRSKGLTYADGDIVVGIPARLTPVKDLPTLLHAFSIASAQNPKLKLIIGGDGEEAGRLKAITRELKIDNKVSFCGWVNDVPRFFASCDIDVLCSISESFPYSVLEGIREGCAIITSNVGGMQKLIDHGVDGYIFEPRDYECFAKYILDLSLDHEKRHTFAKKMREKASQMYSLESMAETQNNIYAQIAILQERKRMGKRDGVVICGAYGRGNSGDEAILKAILNTLRKIDPHLPLTVMTRKPIETQVLHDVRAIYTFNVLAFFKSLSRSRLFINGGGSLIQDMTSSRSLYFYLFTIWAAKKHSCKVLMYGCGIGHVRRRLNCKLSSYILDRNADIITLRDNISLQELEAMKISRPDIRLASDPAISLSPSDSSEADEFLSSQGIPAQGKYICFSLRNWQDFNNFDIYSQAAEHAYKNYGLTAIFLPIEMPKDFIPSEKTASLMSTPYYIINSTHEVELTIALLQKMKLMVAMRLHALVFSAAAGIPFIATSYDIKVNGFMDYVGSPACQNLQDLSLDWLKSEIDKIVADKATGLEVSKALKELEKNNVNAARELLA